MPLLDSESEYGKSGLGIFESSVLAFRLGVQAFKIEIDTQTIAAGIIFVSCMVAAADVGILRDMLH
jgi:hypothetical protein